MEKYTVRSGLFYLKGSGKARIRPNERPKPIGYFLDYFQYSNGKSDGLAGFPTRYLG